MYQNDNQKCLVQNARLSYCALTEPRASQNGGDPKYSVTLLIPKSDANAKADIDAAMQSAMLAGKDTTWRGVMPPNPRFPIHDGDGPRISGEPYGEECRGCWVMTASSKQKPQVVDTAGKLIITPTDIYSGMYGHVTIRFYAYENSGNKGIGCGLGNVMKTSDGEPLGGRSDAATDFAGIASSEPQISAPYIPPFPAQQPQAPAAPQYPQYAPQAPAAPGYPQYAQPQQYAAPQQYDVAGYPAQQQY